jgi:hypothetical protein
MTTRHLAGLRIPDPGTCASGAPALHLRSGPAEPSTAPKAAARPGRTLACRRLDRPQQRCKSVSTALAASSSHTTPTQGMTRTDPPPARRPATPDLAARSSPPRFAADLQQSGFGTGIVRLRPVRDQVNSWRLAGPVLVSANLPSSRQAVGLEQPNAARITDYLLHGGHNLAVDRDAANVVLRWAPQLRPALRANLLFAQRAARHLARAVGVRQFLDLGSGPAGGLPAAVARAVRDARVVYLHDDPVTVGLADALHHTDPRTTVIGADLRDAATVLQHLHRHGVVDLGQPVAVFAIGSLDLLDGGDAAALTAALHRITAPGSVMAVCHASPGRSHALGGQPVHPVVALYADTPTPLRPRGRDELARLLTGYTLQRPGLLAPHRWRPDDPHDQPDTGRRGPLFLAGVGRRA